MIKEASIVRVGGLQEVNGSYSEYELHSTGLLFAFKTTQKVLESKIVIDVQSSVLQVVAGLQRRPVEVIDLALVDGIMRKGL